MYLNYYHYFRQKDRVKSMVPPLPILCHALQLIPRFRNGENKQPIVKWIEDAHGMTFNKTTVLFGSYEPLLIICDVEVMEQLYTVHNAHFDKHPLV